MANCNPIHQTEITLAEAARGWLHTETERTNSSEGELPQEPADVERRTWCRKAG